MKWHRLWNPPPKSVEVGARCWSGAFLLCPVERNSALPAPAPGPWGRSCLYWTSLPPIWMGEGIRQLREILKQLKKGGKTVLMAEHRLWYAADLADRVLYLRGGQLEREYSGQNFLTLTEKERRSMGTAEHCGGTGVLA